MTRLVKNSPELIAETEAAYGLESASVIGRRLGITRNAVIGIWGRGRKAGRIVEMSRERRIELQEQGLARAEATAERVSEILSAEPASLVLQDLSGAARATYEADRPKRTCRWPIGDPRDDSFRFCGEVVEHPVVVGKDGQSRPQAYCEDCRSRAFAPKAERFRAPVLAHAAFTERREVGAGAVRFGRSA